MPLLGVAASRLTLADFLDHLLREYPSTKFLAIRRSFFNEKGDYKDLGNGVLAFKGVYQAIKPALVRLLIHPISSVSRLPAL